MPKVAIKTKGGKSAGEANLSDTVFGAKINIALMHQAVRTEMENSRQDTKNAPGRGDMTHGGKKPWRQKGTGRARQGSAVAPHWRKGGAAHGPHPRDLGHALNKKMRQRAIWSALSAKLQDEELVVIDSIPVGDKPSTKNAALFINEVNGNAKKSLVIIEEQDENVIRSLRNIGNITIRVAPAFSTRDVLNGGVVIVTKGAAAKIDAQWASDSASASAGGEN
jgi:large subunit ribosomal protein L4